MTPSDVVDLVRDTGRRFAKGYGGRTTDGRLSRRRVLVTADLRRAGIPALLAGFHSQLWMVYAAALGLSAWPGQLDAVVGHGPLPDRGGAGPLAARDRSPPGVPAPRDVIPRFLFQR